MTCPVCHNPLPDANPLGGRPFRYCSNSCRQTAYARRQDAKENLEALRESLQHGVQALRDALDTWPEADQGETDESVYLYSVAVHRRAGELAGHARRITDVRRAREWVAQQAASDQRTV